MKKWKNYSIGSNIETINVDFEEILSRSVVDSTINKIIFNKKNQTIPNNWDIAINKILNNNDLNRLLKTDTKLKSKFGKTYVGFDIYNDEPLIWIGDNDPNNRAIRINGMNIFAIEVMRTYATLRDGSPLLRNRIVYTNKTRTVVFQGGFGLQNNNNGTWKDKEDNEYNENTISSANFPMNFVSLETPQYIVDNFENGNIEHDYGVIPCLEFLNKDVLDAQIIDSNLNDWYPAKEFIPLINSYLKYFAWEMNLDHTRIIGLFSNQDTRDIINDNGIDNPRKTLQKLMNEKHIEMSGTDKVINQKLMIKAFGGSDSTLETMNSQLKGAEHIRAIGEIMDLAFKVCGYSWGTEENAVYENVSQTQNSNKRVYETTKEKIELFTRQWSELFCNIFFKIFKDMNLGYTMDMVKSEYEKYVKFEIVSNVLQEQNNNWKKTLEVLKAGVISRESALKMIFPDNNSEEIEQQLLSLKKQEENEKSQINDQFMNENPFGSENDKNNNDLADKDPRGNNE